MKNRWLGLAGALPLLMACNSGQSAIQLTSDKVSQQQIETIISNINQLYPDATQLQKQKAADVVLRAIEGLVFVEGGSFEMGDFGAPCEIPSDTRNRIDWLPDVKCLSLPDSQSTGAHILHKVTLDSYSISDTETRFMDFEWMRQINNLPVAENKSKGYWPVPGEVLERDSEDYKQLIKRQSVKNMAAWTVSWQESKDYCHWLGKVSELPFDLPTEAQWEYAARSRGKKVYFATNNGYRQLLEGRYLNPETGRSAEYSRDEVNSSTNIEEVDAYPPNPLGIYGMSNQVSEWTNDWYSPDYYSQSPELNPKGPETGNEKVMRDGFGETMVFVRIPTKLVEDAYYPTNSFRCSLQQAKVATK